MIAFSFLKLDLLFFSGHSFLSHSFWQMPLSVEIPFSLFVFLPLFSFRGFNTVKKSLKEPGNLRSCTAPVVSPKLTETQPMPYAPRLSSTTSPVLTDGKAGGSGKRLVEFSPDMYSSASTHRTYSRRCLVRGYFFLLANSQAVQNSFLWLFVSV